MQIEKIRSTLSDNWFYLLADDQGGHGVLIDPIDAKQALQRARERGIQIQTVLNTHWHPDHVGGNREVLQATGARLAIPATEKDRIQGGDLLLEDGDSFDIGPDSGRILLAPGHTHGHICLLVGEHLFSGDVIFAGGCGHTRLGGDPRVLYRTFRDVLSGLPPQVLFYPGHDYAARNYAFCLATEPTNAAAEQALARAQEGPGLFQQPLGLERQASPFWRTHEVALQVHLRQAHAELWGSLPEDADDAERAFLTLRRLRDQW